MPTLEVTSPVKAPNSGELPSIPPSNSNKRLPPYPPHPPHRRRQRGRLQTPQVTSPISHHLHTPAKRHAPNPQVDSPRRPRKSNQRRKPPKPYTNYANIVSRYNTKSSSWEDDITTIIQCS